MIILGEGKILSQSPEETMLLGELAGNALPEGGVVALIGPLGSGKTCFAKGAARGLGIEPDHVVSPTFILQNRLVGCRAFNHFDAYRLRSMEEFVDLGADDYLQEEGSLNIIEWAEKVEAALPNAYLCVRFSHRGEKERELCFQIVGEEYRPALERLFKGLEKRER